MKELLQLYAQYNKNTNDTIIRILSELPEEELTKSRNCYYDSLFELFKHVVIASWHYLNAMRDISGDKYCTGLCSLSDSQSRLNASTTEACGLLQEISDHLVRLSEEISEEDFCMETKNLRIYNGRRLDMTIWKYLLQHITHQTHHQGHMSKIFDELKIDHEFGNVFPFIPDAAGE